MLTGRNSAGALSFFACFVVAGIAIHGSTLTPARAGDGEAAGLSVGELHAARSSALDLEVGGELASLPSGVTRYVTRDQLLALPQIDYRVSDDANFRSPTEIKGVSLEELGRHLAAGPDSDLIVAVCHDKYRAFYPRDYTAAHHPVLALEINGQPPDRWTKDGEGHGFATGPYLISHPTFVPRFRIFSQAEEAQIPWGVVRLEFRNEKRVFGAIAPRGPRAGEPNVQAGYHIALQNCFRCHNMGDEGGQKAERPWPVLAAWASASPESFAAYVRNPKSRNPRAEMPGNSRYDDATIGALRAYFQTFAEASGSQAPSEKRQP
jgi:mono/diheme cytochrome c family protein